MGGSSVVDSNDEKAARSFIRSRGTRQILFGGSEAPWTEAVTEFRPVNDSIRGGSSTRQAGQHDDMHMYDLQI